MAYVTLKELPVETLGNRKEAVIKLLASKFTIKLQSPTYKARNLNTK
jgi:hypothetical protein